VLIQMGHNDSGPLDDTNRARGSIRGLGEETKTIFNPLMKKTEVVHTYGWYLRKYIADARAHGLNPILCSPVPHCPRTVVKTGELENNDHVRDSAAVAASEKTPFISLNGLIMNHYAGLPTEEIKAKYFTPADNTHSSLAGAELNAAAVVEGLRLLPHCPLVETLKAQ
jgi:rhamnogalacturonan acetylesterase